MPVKVLVDNRERNLELLERLSDMGIELSFAQLSVGDYVVSDRICIERKSMHDFVSSIINSRLFDELERLSQSYPKPILLVEGSDEEFALSENVLNGTIASIYVDFNIQLIRSKDPGQTAEIIARIAKREQEERGREAIAVGVKRAYSIGEWQMLVLRSLPGVGPKLARLLLKHFKSLKGIANASVEELMEVEKVGKKKAELIHKIMNEEFKEPS